MWRKSVTIHYRRLLSTPELAGRTLEALTRAAMEVSPSASGVRLKDRYKLRMYRRKDDSLFVNILLDRTNLIFGDITHFTKDQTQALFDDSKEDAAIADIQQIVKPEHAEFIHSLMYWMIKGDHVFLLQSQSLRTDSVEEYLTWLLAQQTQTLPTGSGVILSTKFDPQTVGGDLDDIREVVVGGVVSRQPDQVVPPAEMREVEEAEGVTEARLTGWDKAKEILEALFGNEAAVDKIMQKIPAESALSVEVHIGYKTKKRKMSREILKDFEVGLRHLPDSQLEVYGKDGKRSADGSIRLQYQANVLYHTDGEGEAKRPTALLDHNDVLRAMTEAYNNFVSNGKITEENGT